MRREYQSPIDVLVPLLADPPDLSALQDERSWRLIKENAARYGVAPLVAYTARKHVSSGERPWCDRILIDSWNRHQRMLKHLEDLLGLLTAEGIPVIALKGPLLAQRYYAPAFLRKPCLDLDLAVMEPHLEHACHALIRAGYKEKIPIRESLVRSHHVLLTHTSGPTVELHFRLSHMALGIPVDQFFDRTILCPLPGGLEARVLGPADQLLHLILHLATSRFGTLFHLYEIRRVSRAEPPAVLAEAVGRAVEHHYCGVLRMVDIAFRARWGEPFLPPDTIIPPTWLNWRLSEDLYNAFEDWSVPGRDLTLAARLKGRWLDLQITDTLSEALRFARLLTHTARLRITGRGWGTFGKRVYGPDSAR